MMKLKKMVALTLAGVMAASLSACGGGGSAAPETKAAEGGEAPAEGGADAAASDTSGADIVLQVAFDHCEQHDTKHKHDSPCNG